ncbi:MAG: 4Fe-4S binding protein [Endomicrobiales bacterium]|nr:4Fe-4S binding protein [Endomicrobiales bacterium]
MAVKIDKTKCTGCGACKDVCALEAIDIKDNKAVIIDDKCVECNACVDQCPTQAISMSK